MESIDFRMRILGERTVPDRWIRTLWKKRGCGSRVSDSDWLCGACLFFAVRLRLDSLLPLRSPLGWVGNNADQRSGLDFRSFDATGMPQVRTVSQSNPMRQSARSESARRRTWFSNGRDLLAAKQAGG
jgi:hypothetical protein